MEEFFVTLTKPADSLLPLSAWHTTNAIGIQAEAQFFVPVFLFLREEYEWPTTIFAGSLCVKVVCDGERRGSLSCEISGYGRARYPT